MRIPVNHLHFLSKLDNRFYAMRHGHSLANHRGIIVSQPDNGVDHFSLSKSGVSQVTAAISADGPLDARTIIISSDFKRARETAEIAHDILQCEAAIVFDSRLRERNFGDLELSTAENYQMVWAYDRENSDHRTHGVESPNQVMHRMTSLVRDCEKTYSDATVLLVSHGDSLQILQTAFQCAGASRHRELPHLYPGELRQLKLYP